MKQLLNGIETDRSSQNIYKNENFGNVECEDDNIYDEKLIPELEDNLVDPDIVDMITIDIITS